MIFFPWDQFAVSIVNIKENQNACLIMPIIGKGWNIWV